MENNNMEQLKEQLDYAVEAGKQIIETSDKAVSVKNAKERLNGYAEKVKDLADK